MYCFDTSAFLNAWRKHYPPDTFLSFWENLSELIASGNLIATEVVLFELEKKDDEVLKWVKEHNSMFIPLDESVQIRASEILNEFPRLTKKKSDRTEADAFVIALADVTNSTVVTYEQLGGSTSNPKIPYVCRNYGIRCISLIDVIRNEGWTF